jgi:hypothetical protein
MSRSGAYAEARPAVIEMRSRNLWGLVITIAQKYDLQPYSMFDTSKLSFDARSEAWSLLRENGASQSEIAGWWKVNASTVGTAILVYHKKQGKVISTNTVKPGMVRGKGERRENCEHYRTCLDNASRKTSAHCKCPSDCLAFRPVQLRAINFTRSNVDPRVNYNG